VSILAKTDILIRRKEEVIRTFSNEALSVRYVYEREKKLIAIKVSVLLFHLLIILLIILITFVVCLTRLQETSLTMSKNWCRKLIALNLDVMRILLSLIVYRTMQREKYFLILYQRQCT